MKIQRIETEHIKNPARVKKIVSGNVVEYASMKAFPADIPIQRISADEYIDLRTGEMCEYQRAENKSECYLSVRKSMRTLRNILNSNCLNESSLRWITLTYAENMTDTEQLYKDYDKFWKRFKYYCKKHDIPVPEYISVIEPQGRGAWHCHVMLIFPEKAPYLDNNTVIAQLWGHGFAKTKAVHGVDNIGAYFSAYLADLPIDEAQALGLKGDILEKAVDASGKTEYKKFVKGARLALYPAGMNIFRTSRGIARPTETDLSGISAAELEKEKASSGKLTFSNTVAILSDDDEVRNIITHEYYNIKRK